MLPSVPPRKDLAACAAVLGAFAVIHAAAWAAGLRFHYETVAFAWQLLDPELLSRDLLHGVWLLHGQPPLYNLYVGAVFKAFGTGSPLPFQAIQAAMGAALALVLYALQRQLGARPWIAAAVAIALVATPAFLLYEHWLFYTFPLAFLVAVAALLAGRYARTGSRATLAALVWTWAILCATRSLFHLVYFLGALALVASWRLTRPRAIAAIAAAPLLLLLGLHAKSTALFGTFSTSSWAGMSVARVVTLHASRATFERLLAERKISRVSLVGPYSPPAAYPPQLMAVPAHLAPEPAVASPAKSTGFPNLNHYGYIAISRVYLHDAIEIARAEPGALLRGWAAAWQAYFRSATEHFALGAARADLAPAADAYETLLGRDLPVPYLLLALLLLAAFVGGIALARGGPAAPLARPARLLAGYLLCQIAYVALVGNALEAGENNRFRFMTDPLTAVLLGALLERALAWLRRGAEGAEGAPSEG